MKKLGISVFALLALCSAVKAQDIYKVEALSGSDLNGTARYVGMGGAMSALGADLSTIGTNPAGIGMYRRSDISMTGSITKQPDATELLGINKSRGSFDQLGFVYSCKVNGKKLKFVNFAFNYHKRRNFKNYMELSNIAISNGMSQTWELRQMAGSLDLYYDEDRMNTTPIANVAYDTQLLDPTFAEDGETVTGYNDVSSSDYNYQRVQWGGVQEYNFNVSFNVSDRLYAGVTFGFYNVDMHKGVYYDESIIPDVTGLATTPYYYMNHEESVTGLGVDAKFGIIYRPIEDSPFRIGFSFSTPTFYSLSADNYVYMNSPFSFTDTNVKKYHPNGYGDADHTEAAMESNNYDYNVRTPWKLNVSMATTVGNFMALDAEYEISRYSGAAISYPDNDLGEFGWGSNTKDEYLNKEIDNWLKPVSTFKVGAEFRVSDHVSTRLGYNYVTSPFNSGAYLNLFTASPSYYNRSNTDYVNLGAINRVTAGIGYKAKRFYADLAYQYQHQDADVYAFDYREGNEQTNRLRGQRLDLKRHNVMLTIGYKF